MPRTIHPRLRALSPGDIARACVCAAALGGYLFIIAVSGASLFRLLTFYLAAAFWLVGPGLALADWLGPRGDGLRLPLTMLYGIAFLALVHCFSVHFGALWLLYLLPPALAAARLAQWVHTRLAAGQALWPPAPPAWPVWKNGVVLWAVLCLLYAVMLGAVNPHPLAAGAVDLSRDLLWNTGNVTALARAFPAQDIRFAGIQFSYHYLTDLLLSALHLVSGAGAYDCSAFFCGPLFLAGELLALCALCRRYFGPGRERAARLAVLLLFGFQSLAVWKVSAAGDDVLGNTLLKHLVTNINAQATGLIMLCLFLVLFLHISRRGFAARWRAVAALLLAFALLCLAKGPLAAIIVCSFAITMVWVLLLQKPRRGQALACLAGCLAIFAAMYLLLFAGGAGTSMKLSLATLENSYAYRYLIPLVDRLHRAMPFLAAPLWLAGIGAVNAFTMLPFQFLLWLAALPGTVRRLPRLDPACMLLNGGAVGGFLAYHLFEHTSSSQIYFALAGMICLTLLAADPLDRLLEKRPLAWYKWPLWLAGGAAALTTVCIVGACTRQAAAQLAATLGTGPTLATERRAAAEDEAAMRWLDANTDETLVFATNRIDSSPRLDDGISNLYTAFGRRQGYMEGWKYAYTNMGIDAATLSHRLAVNGALFDPATPADELRALCRQEGIQCLVWAKAWGGGVNPALTPDYQNAEVSIYLLAP